VVSFVKSSSNKTLAFHFRKGLGPTIVFLPGFKSNMDGSKAMFLEGECQEKGRPFLRFDYSGHGQSEGEFEEGVISRWAEDAYEVINYVTTGDLILVGSSMGGWISLLLALRLKGRVRGIIGVAAAPDFTEKTMWKMWNKDLQNTLLEKGRVSLPSEYDEPYIITQDLIEDGRNIQLLDDPINLDIPVKLLQGFEDSSVPKEYPERIANCLTSKDVEITFVKGGDHSLSRTSDLSLIAESLWGLHRKISNEGI